MLERFFFGDVISVLSQGIGLRVPFLKLFFLHEPIMKYKFILFSPWLLKSPGDVR